MALTAHLSNLWESTLPLLPCILLLHPFRGPLLLLFRALCLAPTWRILKLFGPFLILEHGDALHCGWSSVVRVRSAIKEYLVKH